MELNALKFFFNKAGPIQTKQFKAGEWIFSQGDKAQHIFSVEEGQVRLERPTIEGRSVVMYTANGGESFAEAALFSDIFHCNAIASRDSVVHFYSKQKIVELIRSGPEKAEELIALLASQVRTLRTKLEIRNILSARERILQFLYLNAHPETGEVFLGISQKELAEELGLAHETLYRSMAQLEKTGMIQRKENKIILHK